MHLRDLLNAAGFVTFLRLPIAVAVPFLVGTPWILPAYLFALATDVVDGMIARRSGTDSAAGAALDGSLDKILHVNLGWSLAVHDLIPDVWMLAWFSREILQLAMFPVLMHRFRTGRGPRPGTSILGRATAVSLSLSVVCALVGVDATVPTVLTGVLGLCAGFHYGLVHLPRRALPPEAP